jgi:murein DD-endopeptidase MepM/ murein hydrolase activator NlpD
MNKRSTKSILSFFKAISKEVTEFTSFFLYYIKRKLIAFSVGFEKDKNRLVKLFLMKRGRYNRPFLHITTMVVLGISVLIAPFLVDTYPIFSSRAAALDLTASAKQKQSVLAGEEVFGTQTSQVRDKTILYTVEKGDTIGTIAQKFEISQDTIRWANDMTGDDLSIGQEIKILPISGIEHKVEAGETVYSIAKKYNTDPQGIVDFAFNDFANRETFTLVTGQMLMVPNAIKPEEQKTIKRQVYIAEGPVPVSPGGFTYPVHGEISQSYSWYHQALDIAAPYGTPIFAAHNGTVTEVRTGSYDTGYGNNVMISNGDGITSHYAHMESVNVSVGQQVVGGSTILGWIGMTGRTTGPHVHFEMRQNGALVNPLAFIQ